MLSLDWMSFIKNKFLFLIPNQDSNEGSRLNFGEFPRYNSISLDFIWNGSLPAKWDFVFEIFLRGKMHSGAAPLELC